MKQLTQMTLAIAGGLFMANTALAAGFQLNEYSTTGMGRAFAGMGVVADDFSALGYNPAGMQLKKTNGAQIITSMVSLHSDFEGKASPIHAGKGHTRITKVLPSGFVQYKLNDKATFGAGLYTPYGLATDYENGWFAEMHAGRSEVAANTLSTGLSYQLTDKFAVGAAVNFEQIMAHLASTGTHLEGDDHDIGYSVGATFTPTEKTRLGLSYRSKIHHELKGSLKLRALNNAPYDIKAELTIPEYVLFSASHDMTDKLTLSASVRWTRWSQFKSLDIFLAEPMAGRPAGSAVSSTNENWRNTWFYSLGADYKYNDNWTFRLGTAYDQSVIKSSLYRTPRIPDGRRIWSSIGASYSVGNWQVDAGYSHLFLKTTTSRGSDSAVMASTGRPNIKYRSDAEMFSLGVQYRF